VSKQEIELASKLIDGMSGKWDANKFEDEYRTALMDLIERKIKSGQTEAVEDVEVEEEEEEAPASINFMDVLKQSVAHASKPRKHATKKRPSKKRAAKKKGTKKRRAG
jgi:DNA end-binding protein Ku